MHRTGPYLDASTVVGLTLAEVVPPEVYELIRAGHLGALVPLMRRRRVVLGEHVSLWFETRETVLCLVHEVLRSAGRWSSAGRRLRCGLRCPA